MTGNPSTSLSCWSEKTLDRRLYLFICLVMKTLILWPVKVLLLFLLLIEKTNGQTELCKSFCDANQYSQTKILGKSVRFYFVEKNWQEAYTACQDQGGNLLKIQSEAENRAVYEFLKERAWGKGEVHTGFSYSYVWLAGNDLDKEGTFLWKPFI